MYYDEKEVDLGFDEAVDKTVEALKSEGFGVLSDIDVGAKLEEKVDDPAVGRYRILGACNPPLANKALEEEKHLGVLLPCNVIVREEDGVKVAMVSPSEMLSVVGNSKLDGIASEVEERMNAVMEKL